MTLSSVLCSDFNLNLVLKIMRNDYMNKLFNRSIQKSTQPFQQLNAKSTTLVCKSVKQTSASM